MHYGHTSSKRTAPQNFSSSAIGFNTPAYNFKTPTRLSDLEKEKIRIFGIQELKHSRRGLFEPTHEDIEDLVTDFISRGGTITKLANLGADATQKIRATSQCGNGIDSGSSIFV